MGSHQSYSPAPTTTQIVVSDEVQRAADLAPSNYTRPAGLGSGVDIRV
jgi:hypothetical protein